MGKGHWLAAALLLLFAASVRAQGYPAQPIRPIAATGIDIVHVALAVASKARNPALPNVPTFDEIGVPGVYSSAWYGIMAPAGVPSEAVNRINSEVNAILKTPEMRKRLADFGGEAGGGSPDDFTRFIGSEIARYADIVKASGAKVE